MAQPISRAGAKRAAASRSGPPSKKANIDGPEKRRRIPVTSNVNAEHDSSDDSGQESDFDTDRVSEAGGVADDQEALSKPVKNPAAIRESRQALKALREQRRVAKPHSALLADAKRLWALARQKDIKPEERQKNIVDLMNAIRGHVKEIVLKHDASRIVQTVVKYGRAKERDEIAEELRGEFRTLAQNKYSKFLVSKLIRLCASHRASILMEFKGHVVRLLLHREASSVVADAFELYGNAYERSLLVRDFYGKETVLFSATSGSEVDNEKSKKGLSGVLEDADDARRDRILSAVKDNLASIFNNSDKGAVSHAIVHRVLWEYVCAVNSLQSSSEPEKRFWEIFETCQDVLAEMVHTKDGSRVVREFLARGTAKDRKIIVKCLKPHVEKMCVDDEAQFVLFTAIDVIDDTKLTSKSLVAPMVAAAPNLYTSSQGRRALIYLLSPRTRRHFTPQQIASLAETDALSEQTSKKARNVREEEIRASASEPLVNWVTDHASSISRDPGGSLLVAEIVLHAECDKTSAIQALLSDIAMPYPSSPENPHPVDLAHTSRAYKALLQGGHFNRTTKQIDRTSSWDTGTFAVRFVEIVDRDNTVSICTKGEKNGLFIVAALCEALARSSHEDVQNTVRSWFTDDVRNRILEDHGRGQQVLLDQLSQL
ncbi:puf family RNA-binding protein [Fistulina hepatica ATCC 64428]|uniref:Puf family RNA-binding protein n=1 Tax=Fistulina hepatica ATCC 64428 TaxID=1128425 RepID=A0A0D7AH98_9AGAR|nr:puf family RNA-binding protein [Fistulina hepatica ATCC 64428]